MYKLYNKTIVIYKVVYRNYKGCSSYCCCLRVTFFLKNSIFEEPFNWISNVAPCKIIQPDSSGFWIPSRGFCIPGNGFWNRCKWNLDSGCHSLVASGFFEIYSRFHNSGFKNLQGKFPRFLIPPAQMSLISESPFPFHSSRPGCSKLG